MRTSYELEYENNLIGEKVAYEAGGDFLHTCDCKLVRGRKDLVEVSINELEDKFYQDISICGCLYVKYKLPLVLLGPSDMVSFLKKCYNKNAWLETFTGIKFPLLNFTPSDFDIEDIAHSLSNLGRYNGHSRYFYSVAEHSIRVSDCLSPGLKLYGLLHDASEAYTGDIISPLKSIMPFVNDYQAYLDCGVRRAFDLDFYKENIEDVWLADKLVTAWEAKSFLKHELFDGIFEGALKMLDDIIVCMSPLKSELEFRSKYNEYTKGLSSSVINSALPHAFNLINATLSSQDKEYLLKNKVYDYETMIENFYFI